MFSVVYHYTSQKHQTGAIFLHRCIS